jgi:GTP pyrophosphokinase
MFQDQVFCFTPKGDLIALPRGATPVDFAYAVHSQVGDRCVGAKIDGRMVQLRTQLNNGDQVDIVTSKNSAPSPEWERFVVTGKARARIRRHLRAQKRDVSLAQGRDALAKAARAEGVAIADRLLEKALDPLHLRSVDDLHVALGEGSVTPRAVLEAAYPEIKRRAGSSAVRSGRRPGSRRCGGLRPRMTWRPRQAGAAAAARRWSASRPASRSATPGAAARSRGT